MREFLKGLDLDKETIDTIMAEHGKLLTEEKEKVSQYEAKIKELSSKAEDNTKVQEELDNLKKSIAENEAKAKAKAEDDALT